MDSAEFDTNVCKQEHYKINVFTRKVIMWNKGLKCHFIRCQEHKISFIVILSIKPCFILLKNIFTQKRRKSEKKILIEGIVFNLYEEH